MASQNYYRREAHKLYKRIKNKKADNKKGKNSKSKKENNNIPNEWHKRSKELNPKYKTKLCKSWINKGCCKYGNNCVFAHSNEELKQCLPVDIYTPKKKLIKTSNSKKLDSIPQNDTSSHKSDIMTTYNEAMYTTVLNKEKLTPKQNEHAEKIAYKIEKNITSNNTSTHKNHKVLDKLDRTQNTKSVVDNNSIFIEITNAIYRRINPTNMRKVSRNSFAR